MPHPYPPSPPNLTLFLTLKPSLKHQTALWKCENQANSQQKMIERHVHTHTACILYLWCLSRLLLKRYYREEPLSYTDSVLLTHAEKKKKHQKTERDKERLNDRKNEITKKKDINEESSNMHKHTLTLCIHIICLTKPTVSVGTYACFFWCLIKTESEGWRSWRSVLKNTQISIKMH